MYNNLCKFANIFNKINIFFINNKIIAYVKVEFTCYLQNIINLSLT